MVDAEGKTSTQLSLSIVEQKNSKLTLQISADKEFLAESTYPVTIDPAFFTSQDWGACDCTYANTNRSDEAIGDQEYGAYVGKYNGGYLRTYVKMNYLPQLNKGDMVIGAYLNMCTIPDTGGVGVNVFNVKDMNIGAYQVTGNWDQSTLTWNNKPTNSDVVIDYVTLSGDETNKWKKWNVSKCAKLWYIDELNFNDNLKDGNNKGIMLKSLDGSSETQNASFYSSNIPVSAPRPAFEIVYRNNKGIEDYWTYSSFQVGTAGTVYVNDYSGSMVFIETDAITPSGYAQASVQHVFNSYMVGEKYTESSPSTGKGWKLNVQQTLYPSSKYELDEDAQKKYPYVYTDADGTEHYFYDKTPETKTNSEEYYDEDGLGLTLKFNTDPEVYEKYVISDDKNNRYLFYENGVLSVMIDSNGNRTDMYFGDEDDSVITSVSDDSCSEIKFTINNGRLTHIIDPSQRSTQYKYDSNLLTEIVRPGENSVLFTYNDRGLIKSITDIDGYKVVFTYTSAKLGSKVNSITEKGTSNTAGQKITFDRTKYNTTIIKTYGADGLSGTNDDLTSTYQFDEFGRTISIKSKTKTKDLGATVYRYTDGEVNSTASNIKQLNRVSSEYGTGSSVSNLIENPNFETATLTNWTHTSWMGTNEYTATLVSTQQYFGQKSLKVNVTSYENDSRARIYQDFSSTVLKPGETYTLSGYIKATSLSDKKSNLSGAFIAAQSNNSDGTYDYFNSDIITSSTGTTVNNGWQRVVKTFTVPENSAGMRISLVLRSAKGTVYFDGIQLEKSNVPNNFNLLENADFEAFNSSGKPTSWTDENSNLDSTDIKDTSKYYQGNSSFRIQGSCTKEKGLVQTVNIKGSEEDTYIVSGWAKADAVANNEDDERKFRIALRVTYDNGETVVKKAAEFNYAVSDWQYTSTAFNLSDQNANTQRNPVKIKIILRYHNQCNTVYFDNFSLIKDSTHSYTYDEDGNVISVSANAQKQSTMEYTNSDLTKNIDAKGYKYEYTYDDNHNMTQAKSQSGIKYNYSYNGKGLAKLFEIKYGTNSIKTSATYNSDGLIKTVTDQHGNIGTYTYDDYKRVSSVTANDVETSYTYNPNTDALKSVTKEGSSIEYLYSRGSKILKQITHNDTNYKIAYDEYGNAVDYKVGSQSLASYTYNSNDISGNGALSSSTYGNGNTMSWTYDAFGNKSYQYNNGKKSFRWWADQGGNVIRERDLINDIQYDLSYDTTGRLVRQVAKKNSAIYKENGLLYKVGYNYDLNNNITNVIFNTPIGDTTTSRIVNSTYEYKEDNLLSRFDINESISLDYRYDKLNRLTETILSTSSNVNTLYTYVTSQRSDATTTTRLATESIDEVLYEYSYDNRGNIIEIYKTDIIREKIASYTYDKLNQLSSYTDYVNSKTYTYTYNKGGNITKEVIEDTVTGQTVTNTYLYEDTNWKDKLTKYNDTTITYDAIGNPLSYRDGITMTWTNGRQLASLQDSDNSVSYTYNSGGVRVSKTVDGVKHTYAYVNGLLMYETRGSQRFWYSYDANGILCAVRYTLTDSDSLSTYFFTHNSRGDIVGIYNSSGALKVQYEYDAWGNVLSVTNANGNAITNQNHIGNLNPFRYRGYYYDVESGLYYLMSRYYDPVTHRFVNADGYFQSGGDVLDANMSAYCRNNPIMFVDPTGEKCYLWDTGRQGPLCPNGMTEDCCYIFNGWNYKNNCVAHINPNEPPDHPNYIPPKKSGAKKVKNPNGQGNGWLDKNGDVWVPTPNMHGGEGWTVQQPGGGHYHGYPGGHIRKATYERDPLGGGAMIAAYGLMTLFLFADDATVLGIADDALVPMTSGFAVVGWDKISGKYVCECGESW